MTVATVLAIGGGLGVRAGGPSQWDIVPVSDSTAVTRPVAAVDSGGNALVAWTETGSAPGLYFATDQTGAWTRARVTTSADDKPVAVGTTVAGPVRILLRRPDGLAVATRQGASWTVTEFLSTPGLFTVDGVMDKAGAFHVAFESAAGLEYGTDAGGAPSRLVLPNPGTCTSILDCGPPTLRLGPNGRVYILQLRGNVRLITNASGQWKRQDIPAAFPCAVRYPHPRQGGLAIDPWGTVFIALSSGASDFTGTYGTCFITNRSGSFRGTLLPVGARTTVLMALDRRNVPHLAFLGQAGATYGSGVPYATWNGDWVVSPPGSTPFNEDTGSLMVTDEDLVRLAYHSGAGGEPGVSGPIALGTRAIAGPVPPFGDLFLDPFYDDIVWLHTEGLTSGCGGGRYCSSAFVTRGQMASFLARALELPPPVSDHFSDDDGTTHEADINRIAEAGVTFGCAPNAFCPTALVTRGQMASFLARALNLPATSTDFFTDDSGSTHEAGINRVAAAGIAKGCGSGLYCPNDAVTRGQMAAFLHRALTP